MEIVNVLEMADYAEGQHAIPVTDLPDTDDLIFGLRVKREVEDGDVTWPESVEIEIMAEASFDGGLTWKGAGGFTSKGGIYTGREETIIGYSYFRGPIPNGTSRKIRGTMKATGGAVRTSVDLIYEAL